VHEAALLLDGFLSAQKKGEIRRFLPHLWGAVAEGLTPAYATLAIAYGRLGLVREALALMRGLNASGDLRHII
jgi:hypothetical protein